MRDYGKVYSRYWLNKDTGAWCDRTKLLSLYLLTCHHCNLIGCFRLPSGYICADMNWSEATLNAALGELSQQQFILRCEQTGWTLIQNYLKHNGIENPNQAKAAAKLLRDVPDDFLSKTDLLAKLTPALQRFSQHINNIELPSLGRFDEFWSLQLRKEHKHRAKEEWLKHQLHQNDLLAHEVLLCWREQRQHRAQYQQLSKVPLPSTWLANQQWQDRNYPRNAPNSKEQYHVQ